MEDKNKANVKKKAAKKKAISKKKPATKTKKVTAKKVAVKKVVKNKVSKKKMAVKKQAKKPNITLQQRYEHIAKAAYYRAEARGFRGDSIQDWLDAEAEVDAIYQVKK